MTDLDKEIEYHTNRYNSLMSVFNYVTGKTKVIRNDKHAFELLFEKSNLRDAFYQKMLKAIRIDPSEIDSHIDDMMKLFEFYKCEFPTLYAFRIIKQINDLDFMGFETEKGSVIKKKVIDRINKEIDKGKAMGIIKSKHIELMKWVASDDDRYNGEFIKTNHIILDEFNKKDTESDT